MCIFYQNVFDGRANKMVENMDECEKSVAEVIENYLQNWQVESNN